jgi:hypothetical protein
MKSTTCFSAATILLTILVFLSGCSKTSTNTNNPPPVTPVDTPVVANVPDIYAAGRINLNGLSYAAYWKNNQLVKLSDTSSEGDHIMVVGSDVYVSGNGGFANRACYWKNGVFTSLYHGNSQEYTSAMCSSGQDVYIAGSGLNTTNQVAEYWKNGQAVVMKPDSEYAAASGIAVSGADVYLVGYEYTIPNNPQAVLWKNGTAIRLTNNSHLSMATGIFIQGTDIYVCGVEDDHTDSFQVAKYWKNGIATALSDSTSCSFAHSIFVSGNDVYVSGFQHPGTILNSTGPGIATYWKNGVATKLFDGSSSTDAYTILFSNSDVYSAYYNSANTGASSIPSYLKNKIPQMINAGSSVYGVVSDVFIK